MKKLLSLPPNLVGSFHEISGLSHEEYFCTCDPEGTKVGSGGGTTWLLKEAYKAHFMEDGERAILLHAGGQSRRLPGYASSGKVLTPVPVFRWARGQRIDQTLLDLQMPLYESIMKKAPESLTTMIVSGDVMIRATEELQNIPEADVVCYGLWADPVLCSHHGTFLMNRERPSELDFMLQKPSTDEQARLMPTHLVLMDIGVWILSNKAVKLLMSRSYDGNGQLKFYDLYSQFGCCLGNHPSMEDKELAELSVRILPLPGGEFYHFGTTPELLSSTLALQNLVKDQRYILQRHVKQQPSLFTQNCLITNPLVEGNENVWVENSYLGEGWHLSRRNVITGVPENNWNISVKEGICVDIVPIGETQLAVRPYGWDDAFRGDVTVATTKYLGQSFPEWAQKHGYTCGEHTDLQATPIFPVVENVEEAGSWLSWMLSDGCESLAECPPKPTGGFLSADQLSSKANLRRLFAQRRELQRTNLKLLADNWRKSVFYQTNLCSMAEKYKSLGIQAPEELPESAPLMTRIHNAMFRSHLDGNSGQQAYDLLREGLTMDARSHRVMPYHTTHRDQIVWGRSPVRIDVAGGWTDTPPYSLYNGGSVVNFAIELNGQPPLQVYVKPCDEPIIICRSIDLGAIERIETYEDLAMYDKVGSPFSIPKAALTLCGFLPEFCQEKFSSLKEQLQAFGCGIEITLLAAIPAGSGLGTSSVLAATVLGALNNFCNIGWGRHDICNRTLILEQLLTTGGGWQDQYGGVFGGVKLLQTKDGFDQNAVVRWLPDTIFHNPDYSSCHLLYYTGITRTAKHILAEIVRNMFLNESHTLALLDEMNFHTHAIAEAMQRGQFELYGQLVRKTWQQNCQLDPGTNPATVQKLCAMVDDLCLGYKLPGAGGGGYLYMVAKDDEAARRIHHILTENPLAPTARFVDMSISQGGLQISRS